MPRLPFSGNQKGSISLKALGLNVIAATSTIAQGLNLPCDVVILAGTDRSVEDD